MRKTNIAILAAATLALSTIGAMAGSVGGATVDAVVIAPVETAVNWTGAYAGVSVGGVERVETHGGFVGYRSQLANGAVLGGEFDYRNVSGVDAFSLGVQAGYAYGRFLPYATIVATEVDNLGRVYSAGLGVDYRVNSNISVGAQYLTTFDGDVNVDADTWAVRAAYHF